MKHICLQVTRKEDGDIILTKATPYTLTKRRLKPAATRYTLFVVLILLTACASPRAFIDKSAMRQIIWPGYPEKPRIQYLWSINQISTTIEGRKRGLLDFILGEVSEDVTDPRTSNVLMRPYGIFVDSKERLYVTDPGAYRVTVIDLNTAEVITIYGREKDEFLSPIGVVADLRGRIYVSDSELRKVFVFDEKGGYLSQFEGEFKRPTCMAIDTKSSMIYLSDTLEHKVYIYSLEGKRLSSIGKPGSLPGEFNFPTHLFVDKDGLLYVTDAMNFRVQIFNPEGTFLGKVGILSDTYTNLDMPKGVAVDTHGNIYVVDSIWDTIKIFDRDGSLLLFFGEKGHIYGNLYLPSGIFIDQKNIIYVADTYNMRVQAFQFIGEK
ncbi:MAG: 6-bladed beta-propeller [Thermodesulfovibrionia bacterium]|nr:6-bladed beta-propeller [Thermodesulfovibrionia bacterium]